MTAVKIITANANVYPAHQRAARHALSARGAHLIGTQETDWLGSGVRGFTRHYGADYLALEGDSRKWASHNRIFAADGFGRYEGHGAYQVTDAIAGDKFAPERWIIWVRLDVDGHRLVLIDTHINAVLQTHDGSLRKGLRIEYAHTHMQKLGMEIRRQQADGWDPIVTLDSNYARRPGQRLLWRYSPHRLFPRAGLAYWSHHIDGIALPKGSMVWNAGRFEIPGGDHDGFELTANIARRHG